MSTAPEHPPLPPPTPSPYHGEQQTSTLAVISLVSGIVSWVVLPVIGSIVAIITGHLARAEIRRQPQRLGGGGLAMVGLVLGYLQIVALILGIAFLFLFLGGLAYFGWYHS